MAADGATVLVVDDEPLNVDLLEQELGAAGYKTVSAASGEQAVIVAAKSRPDLILLDVMMPGMDGYAVCQSLKQSEATRDIPVVFLTALTDTFEKVRAFKLGAVDYVTKPFQPEELLARVGTHIALRREIEAHRKSRATIQRLVDEMRHDMVGDSPAVQRLRGEIAQVGPTDSTVLIQGETGTGKELVARAIHEASRRRGRFELADGGTLFLDEVGELPLEAQAKLLRVLQSGEFDRVGGTRALHADVRVIAATNRDLQAQVTAGRFRSDLYYRLNVFPITVPPLRERRGDIPGLAQHFAAKASRKLGKPLRDLSGTFLERAGAYDWPGNIRELENMVERALILADGELLFPAAAPAAGDAESLEDVERSHIRSVLERTRWVIEGDKGAARILGLNPSTLRGRLRKLGIRKTS